MTTVSEETSIKNFNNIFLYNLLDEKTFRPQDLFIDDVVDKYKSKFNDNYIKYINQLKIIYNNSNKTNTFAKYMSVLGVQTSIKTGNKEVSGKVIEKSRYYEFVLPNYFTNPSYFDHILNGVMAQMSSIKFVYELNGNKLTWAAKKESISSETIDGGAKIWDKRALLENTIYYVFMKIMDFFRTNSYKIKFDVIKSSNRDLNNQKLSYLQRGFGKNFLTLYAAPIPKVEGEVLFKRQFKEHIPSLSKGLSDLSLEERRELNKNQECSTNVCKIENKDVFPYAAGLYVKGEQTSIRINDEFVCSAYTRNELNELAKVQKLNLDSTESDTELCKRIKKSLQNSFY